MSDDVATPQESSEPQQTEAPQSQPSYAGTKHRVKLFDQEVEVPYEQLVQDYQAGAASQKRFEEAARLRKEADEILSGFEKGDLSAFKKRLPADKRREWAEKELLEYIEEEELRRLPDSDPNKRATLAERERDRLKAEKDARDQDAEKTYRAQVDQEAITELDTDIAQAVRALKEELGHDVLMTPELFEHISRVMLAELEADETVTKAQAGKATKQAWKGIESTVKYYIDTIPEQKLIAMLSPKQREAIRRADVGDVMNSQQSKIRDRKPDGNFTPGKKNGVAVDDFFTRIEKKFGN